MKQQEFFDRAVIRFFYAFGEITGGQLILTPVVGDTLATDTFAGAGLVGAIAAFFIDLDLAFHPEDILMQMKSDRQKSHRSAPKTGLRVQTLFLSFLLESLRLLFKRRKMVGAEGFGALCFTSGRPPALTNMTSVMFVSKCSLQILQLEGA